MDERKVITSVVLSLALHAGGLGTLALVGTRPLSGDGTPSQLGLPAGFELAMSMPAQTPMIAFPTPPPLPPEPLPMPEPKPPPPEVMPSPEFEEPEVPLGIEDSVEPNKVWKGSKEATENLAPKSKVDQAARSMDPMVGSKGELENSLAQKPAAASQPSPAAAALQSSPPRQQSEPEAAEPLEKPAISQPEPVQGKPVQELPKQDKEQQLEPQQLEKQQLQPQQLQAPVPGQPETNAANADMQLPKVQPQPLQPDAVQPVPTQPKPVQEAVQQLEEQQLSPEQIKPLKEGVAEGTPKVSTTPNQASHATPPVATTPPSPAAQASPGSAAKAAMSENDPGKKSDEESAAAAIVGSLVYKPGEPLAGKGLKVSTVRPKFGFTTMAIANPRDVVVNVTFGRDGRVIRAVFKDAKGTGFEDVDKPLIEAVYRWTAKGEALAKIPAGKPHAGVTFAIKFLWGADSE